MTAVWSAPVGLTGVLDSLNAVFKLAGAAGAGVDPNRLVEVGVDEGNEKEGVWMEDRLDLDASGKEGLDTKELLVAAVVEDGGGGAENVAVVVGAAAFVDGFDPNAGTLG